MKLFHYVVDTNEGKRMSGALDAADETAARQQLAARGLTIVTLSAEDDVDDSIELVEDQLATLVQAVGTASANRVPLDVTLAALAEENSDPRLAKVARQLSAELQRGATVDEAVASLGRHLPPEVGSLLRAGVECGDLAGTVEQFAQQQLAAQRSRLQIRSAIAYPIIVLALLLLLALFLSRFVVPMFGQIFAEFDLALPKVTVFVVATARHMPALLAAVLGLVIGLPILLRLVGGRWLLHRVRMATPFVGRLWTWSGQREFAGMLGSFLGQRIPMPSAIAHTGEVLSDRNLARACHRLYEQLVQGQPLSESMGNSIHFDRSLVALVVWGEQHGLLPEALRIATMVFDDRIDQHTSLIRRVLPPLTMVVVAALTLLVTGSLLLPLVKLIEGLSG